MKIAFSFLSILNDDYKKYIVNFGKMDKENWLHFDVMDGLFVPNYTFNSTLVKKINEYNNLFSDVHLMISDVENNLDSYIDAKVNQITFHYEASEKDKIIPLIKKIKNNNIKVGLSIKPDTHVTVLNEYLGLLDYVLIMSVEPGKGGQTFIENSLEKISYLSSYKGKYNYLIGVDGGINDKTSKLVKDAGADVVVVGTYLVNNFNADTLNKLK